MSSGFFRHLAHFDGLGGRAFISWARACLEVFWAVLHFVVGHFAFQVTFWDPDGPWTTRWIIPFSSLASLEPLVRRRPCLLRRCRSAPARVSNYQMREAESVSRLVVCVPHAALETNSRERPPSWKPTEERHLEGFCTARTELWEVKHHYTLRFIAIFVFIIDFLVCLLELKMLVLSCTVGKISNFVDKFVFIGIRIFAMYFCNVCSNQEVPGSSPVF